MKENEQQIDLDQKLIDPSFASIDDSFMTESNPNSCDVSQSMELNSEKKVFESGPKELSRRGTFEDIMVCHNNCLTKYF